MYRKCLFPWERVCIWVLAAAVAGCICGGPNSSPAFSREPGRLASLFAHSGLLSLWQRLLCSAVVREYLAAFQSSWHSPECHFPVCHFCHWRWQATASLVFSQELAQLLTVRNSHRVAGELNIAFPGRGADWPEEITFLPRWATRSFSPHLYACHQPSENMDWAHPVISQHNLFPLLPHIRGHCQDTVVSTNLCECREVEKEPRQEAIMLYLLGHPEANRAAVPPYAVGQAVPRMCLVLKHVGILWNHHACEKQEDPHQGAGIPLFVTLMSLQTVSGCQIWRKGLLFTCRTGAVAGKVSLLPLSAQCAKTSRKNKPVTSSP